MANSNYDVLRKVWDDGLNMYQARIPEPTQSNIAEVQEAIFDYEPAYNAAAKGIVNLISSIIFTDTQWANRLGFLKRDGSLGSYGSTIEEIAFGLITAENYDLNAVEFFKTHKSEVYAAFHTLNSQLKYPVTIFPDELKKAFYNEGGLDSLITGKLNAISKSAELDEYNIMIQLIAEAYAKDGITRVEAPLSANPTVEELQNFSQKIRETAKNMTIVPTTHYNRKGIPAVSRQEDLVLLVTPRVTSAMDVKVLANAFNPGMTDLVGRVIEVKEFPIPGVEALLVDRNWFIVADSVRTMKSFENPENLGINFWLHKWTIYSVSPFNQAAIFGTAEAFEIPTVTYDLTGITAAAKDAAGATVTEVTGGDELKLVVTAQGTSTPADPENWALVTAHTVDITATEKISSKTNVSEFGIIRIQEDIKPGTVLTFTVTSAYINPSTGEKPGYTSVFTLTVPAEEEPEAGVGE